MIKYKTFYPQIIQIAQIFFLVRGTGYVVRDAWYGVRGAWCQVRGSSPFRLSVKPSTCNQVVFFPRQQWGDR